KPAGDGPDTSSESDARVARNQSEVSRKMDIKTRGSQPSSRGPAEARHPSVTWGIGEELACLRLEDGDEGAVGNVTAVFRLLLGCKRGPAVTPGQVFHTRLQLGIGLQRKQPSG